MNVISFDITYPSANLCRYTQHIFGTVISLTSVVCLFLLQEQYTLCFELLQAYLDSFDTYANFKAL